MLPHSYQGQRRPRALIDIRIGVRGSCPPLCIRGLTRGVRSLQMSGGGARNTSRWRGIPRAFHERCHAGCIAAGRQVQ
jgi:hypothetical protein